MVTHGEKVRQLPIEASKFLRVPVKGFKQACCLAQARDMQETLVSGKQVSLALLALGMGSHLIVPLRAIPCGILPQPRLALPGVHEPI